MRAQAPPHSIGPPPELIHEEAYDERNRFLFLLLGMISVIERSLGAQAGAAPTDESSDACDTRLGALDANGGGTDRLFR